MNLTTPQLEVIESPLEGSLFLRGPAGSGKTTAGIYRLQHLIESGLEGRRTLLFFPQRNLGSRYQDMISSLAFQGHSLPSSATYGGLARRLLDLFWPAIVNANPQLNSDEPPTFLTLESTLYFLSTIVDPLITEQGYFSTVTLQRNRLYSQILDNLNKAAIHGFPHTEIAERLVSAWIGDPSQEAIYAQAQEAASKFRNLCYSKNLLDFSLQIELFTKSLQGIPLLMSWIRSNYSHLIYDNAEEDIPVAHDFIRSLLPSLDTGLVIYDDGAGYRSFLGASPDTALMLEKHCQRSVIMAVSYSTPPQLTAFNDLLVETVQSPYKSHGEAAHLDSSQTAFSVSFQPTYPQLVHWIAEKVRELIEGGTPPGEIVILAPFLSDSLRFLLSSEFARTGIPHTSHRPSRALRDEPVTRCLLTLSALAHPQWGIHPSYYELALAFMQVFSQIDLTRAYLLSRSVLQTSSNSPLKMAPFEAISPEAQQRISYSLGMKYQHLHEWLHSYHQSSPQALDHFLSRLFGELLTRPDFGFYNDLLKGRVTSQIIESFFKFRKTAASVLQLDPLESGQQYYRMVKTGVLANQYLRAWTDLPADSVLIAPAYTFLLNNSAAAYQFWLDIGSRGWYERIYQPLTNPHVLNRNWDLGRPWTDAEETSLNTDTLACLVTGLIRRCRGEIIGCLTEMDERGFEQKGLLLQALNTLRFQRPAQDHQRGGLNGD